MIYKNDHGSQIYPFVSPTPFPTGLIADIKICIKQGEDVIPFVSSISSGAAVLTVTLSAMDVNGYSRGVLCTFSYADNLWITADTDKVFGFLQLNYIPQESFSYSGMWKLSRRCYTFGLLLGGVNSVGAQDVSAAEGNLLQMRTSGLLTERDRLEDVSINGQQYDTVLNIGRDTGDTYTTLTEAVQGNLPYISTVNGINCTQLLLNSSDAAIQITPPVYTGNSDVYVMYINTTGAFPHCPQWDTPSDSSSGALGE